ncbi:MAG: transporter substrate-binding domain-containing protein [Acidobacteriota bacterium]
MMTCTKWRLGTLMSVGTLLLITFGARANETKVSESSCVSGIRVAILESPENFAVLESELIQAYARSTCGTAESIELRMTLGRNAAFLERGMADGQYDVLGARWVGTPEREKNYCLVPYMPSALALLAHEESGIDSRAGLAGKRVCVLEGTTYLDRLPPIEGLEAVYAPDPNSYFGMFQNGDCDAALLDSPLALALSKLRARVVDFLSTGDFLMIAFSETRQCNDFARFLVRSIETGGYQHLVGRLFPQESMIFLRYSTEDSPELAESPEETTPELIKAEIMKRLE